MLLDEFVEIKVTRDNARYLMELGYDVEYELDSRGRKRFRKGNVVNVKIKDLQDTWSVKVNVLCDFCKRPYKISYNKYIQNNKNVEKCACKNCVHLKQKEMNMNKYGKPSFNGKNYTIDDIKGIFDSLDFTLVSTEYVNAHTPLNYICNKHKDKGIQTVTLNNLKRSIKNGHNSCTYCSYEHRQDAQKKNFDEIKKFFKERHCTLLSTEDDYINAKSVLFYQCDYHPDIVQKTTWMTFRVSGGCSLCLEKSTSRGEIIINNYLLDKNIKFNREYWFDDCKDILPLPFDFAIQDEDNNIIGLCEFNGKQHYECIEWFGGIEKFEKQKLHDEIKYNYCSNNNIPLLIISYRDFANIEMMLDDFIQTIFMKGVA